MNSTRKTWSLKEGRFHLLIAIGLMLCDAGVLGAADWPQWRGPKRDGVSTEKGMLKAWPEEGPKLVWEVSDLGAGFSTPSVVGDRLYLLSNEGLENESVLALSTRDGKKVWSQRLGKVGNPDQQPNYPAARSTPTVEGSVLYALSSDGDLVCLETAEGKLRWQKNLRTDFGGKPGKWAYAESPLIDADRLICTPGGSNATVVALNKKDGSLIWKCAVPGGDEAAYASAIAVEVGGVKQYVQLLQKGVVGIEARTGKFLWRYDRVAKGSPANIPTPVADGPVIYTAAGRSGGALLNIISTNGGFEPVEIKFSQQLPTSLGGTVKVGDYLYGSTIRGMACAVFKTGEVKWEDTSLGPGSVCYADGLLFVHSEKGVIALVEATPEGYREKGRFTPQNPPDRGNAKAWPYPLISDGKLFVRDGPKLWCFAVK